VDFKEALEERENWIVQVFGRWNAAKQRDEGEFDGGCKRRR